MSSKLRHDETTFTKIKVISNLFRFKILELTQENSPSITELSSQLSLSYTKCADYVTMLGKHELIQKIRHGKETRVKSKVKLRKGRIEF